ncbi:LssY C-terminal domain-containing protein [Bradyrhizobium lablabi]|nr:LssY C-terminal domain-containing protein [Bradyrhizobium lablabi]MBR0695559.1 LssY C-terminal domain-containing protein [Bradyrhizobium lablabi]
MQDIPHTARRHGRFRRVQLLLLLVLIIYLLAAYLALPVFWTHYEHQKWLADLPMVTRTAQGIPGDPMNIGLIGDRADVICAMHEAGWYPADPITLKSSIEIVGSVLLDRPYKDAPVSNLFYLGRREDLAFEKPIGTSADRRNHVRYWKVLDQGEEKRPVWLGSATLDRSVGVSHYTGAVTHHIDADLDAERARLTGDLEAAGMVTAKYQVTGIGPTLAGRNGGGDRYYTDGEIWVLRLVEACRKHDGPVEAIPSPAVTEFKDQLWHAVVNAIGH